MNPTIDMSDVFEVKKKFYSRKAVALNTFLLSPLLGCIMFSFNLKEIGKGKLAPVFIVLSIVWIVAFERFSRLFIVNPLVNVWLGNLLASLLLGFPLWKKFIGDEPYISRLAWKPVAIFLAICIFFLAFSFFGGRAA